LVAMVCNRAPRGLLAMLLMIAACAGCASLPQDNTDAASLDRLERVNRGIYRFNRGVDRRVVRPVARAYDRVVPPRVERRFRHFFTNLRAPTDIANHWLQGKFKPGFAGLGRFLLNTVAGGGFFDPAAKLGLERHPEDFGQTLAAWGVPSGGYFVMPFFGPGSVRDWGAWPLDVRADALWQLDDSSARNWVAAWRLVSDRAALLPAERTLEESFDEYALVREAWWERRRYQIFDEAPPVDEEYLFLESEP
jgi:phospholipid-binding lipoprotein MlaA